MAEPEPQRRVIFQGRKIDLALQRVENTDGSHVDREVVLHPGAVALLPMVDADHVCLVRNLRYGANATLLEVPAGTLDPGESPESTAVRELREETGYTAARLTKLSEWWVAPATYTERMYVYLCEGLTPGPTDHQPDEHIEPVVVAWDDALAMVADGRIDDAKTMLAILFAERWFRRP